jgi:hypothetical protein
MDAEERQHEEHPEQLHQKSDAAEDLDINGEDPTDGTIGRETRQASDEGQENRQPSGGERDLDGVQRAPLRSIQRAS